MKDYLKEYLYSFHWDPSKALMRAIEARMLAQVEFIEPTLDIACGDGIFSSIILKGNSVFSLDINLSNAVRAQKKGFYSGIVVCDAANLPFKNGSCKSLLVNSFLEHVAGSDLDKVLREAHRVLISGGKAFVTLNNSSFGKFDPMQLFFEKMKLRGLSYFWEKRRNARLALFSLKRDDFWLGLFERMNFRVAESKQYFPPNSEKKFFFWLNIQGLGIWRLNLGSVIRSFSEALSFFGINLQRSFVCYLFGRSLRADYLNDGRAGCCSFFILEKNSTGYGNDKN
ncbi:MAG: class I SAM-dependent methyltransferase [Candidatus Omnitrophica bacterium]|nr:class I SAM-dependent methyltransferase [Candidatus Omnitrophota bacterium]MBU1869064.1 class I SAM-dependent methyltransferase [Candidatus Omnitrophota bacterium]